jgi:predicted transcriptional regulator
MDMNHAVALAIRRRMIVTEDTYRSLSQKARIPERSLARILKPERDINVNRLRQIAEALKTTPEDLIADASRLL